MIVLTSDLAKQTIPAAYFKTLANLHMDGLATAASICNARATVAPAGSRSRTLWLNRRELVIAEIDRRGWMIRKGSDARYLAEPRG